MARHDCVILYNAASISEVEGSEEKIYPSTIIREEVGAIEESLREGGFNPLVLAVDNFSKDLVQTLVRLTPKFVFNLCEEINSRVELESCVAGLLEMMDVPYTGSGPFTLGLALNKFYVKQLLRAAGIPVAKGYLHSPGRPAPRRSIRFPVIVKPVHEDGSLGVNSDSVCHDTVHLERQVDYIHAVYKQDALVEEYLDGREFNVSIVGDRTPEVLAISEIDFSEMPEHEPRIVSYRAKWDEESKVYGGTRPLCPASVSRRLEKRIKNIALRSYRIMSCRDYARIDLRTDSRGTPYVLEVNPNPDISPRAGFARAARAAGMSYTEMILGICRAAMARNAASASVYTC
jgi:D-alanine-D-alanine ligase